MFKLLSSFLVIDITSSVCPDSHLLKPCSCVLDETFEILPSITCKGTEVLDLVKIFQTLGNNSQKSGKHFKSFDLINPFITELKENTFSDITFDTIYIKSCDKLSSIHAKAFSKTDQVTAHIIFELNPLLSDNSLFEIINKFNHAQSISLFYNGITEIPSNAFKNKQDNLKILYIFGQSIKKLGNNAFSVLKNLSVLSLVSTSIDFIPENAFEFNEESNQSLTLYLLNNKFLNSSGLSTNSLTKLKRPTKLEIDILKTNYLNQKIFEPYLLTNTQNVIKIWSGFIDCQDCRNYWIKRNASFLKRLIETKCSNQKLLNDTDNFKNCID